VAKHCELCHGISPSLKAIPFMKQLRADWNQGMLAVIFAEYFVFRFAIQKWKD
jgi:hypothetical protein